MARNTDVVSVRMYENDLKALQALSIVYERPVGELIREAVGKYVEVHRNDPGIKEQIAAARKKQEDLYKALLTPREE